jgi:tetratricopeptide (TPR) repeat protein
VDARADLYSLGCLLYEMLAGCPPFVGPTPQAILARHACDTPAPLRTVRPALPPGIEGVVTRLLAKVPADRFPSASALKAALAKTGTVTVAVPAPRASRRWLVAGLALAVAVAAGAALARPRGGTAPQPAWLLVGDFVGPADDSTLADAVRELVTVELDQSASISTLPRQQVSEVLRSAGLPDSALLTPALARELAYRTSVRAVLSGSVLSVGRQGYSITLRVMSTEDGRQIASVGEATGPDDLIRTAEQRARARRSRLGDRREDIAANRPLEQVATPSFAAYRRYVQGLQRIYSGDLAGGNRLLEEAVQLDSAFASAWAALGESHIFGRNLDSAKHAYARALAFPDRLTDPQRLRLEADVAYAVRHDLPAAIGWYDLYLAERPWSVSVRNNRALYLSSLGRHADALEEFQRAVAINPFRPEGAQIELLNTAAELVVLGRVPEAEAAARDLSGPFADYFALLRPAALSDWAGADSVAARVADAPDTPSFLRIQARTTRAAAKAARGAVAEAERLLDDAAADAAGEERRWYQHARLLLAVCLARSPGTMPRSLAADSTAPGWVVRALWAAVSGDSAGAARALERAAEAPVEPGRVGAGPALVQGWIDAAAGRWHRVTDNLAPVAQQGEHDATMLDRSSSFPLRWLVAEAYGRLGRNDSARAYLGLVLAPRNMPPGHFALRGIAYPHAHRRLALLSGQAGLSDSAAAHWDRFTRSFSRPDPDLQPLLQQAPGSAGPTVPGDRRGK